MEAVSNAVMGILNPLMDLGNSIDFSSTHVTGPLTAEFDKNNPLVPLLGSETLAKYMLGMFIVYPFAILLQKLPSAVIKHFFSLVGGVFLMQWVYGPSWIHSFITSAVTYLLCIIAPRKHLPMVVFVWVMGYMVAAHIFQMVVTKDIAYESKPFDFTGTQMVLTMKLTSFAYNLYDGTYDKERVAKIYDKGTEEDKKYSSRREFMVTSLPNPLEFFGYIYCFTCILAGPAFEYRNYIKAIDGTAFENKWKHRTPSSIPTALFCLLQGVGCLVLHMLLTGMLGDLGIPKFLLTNCYNDTFIKSHDMLYKFIYLYFALFASRMKFYFAWKVAEGSCVMGGFGFQGFTEKGAIGWSGVQNVDMLGFEMSTNVQELSRAWNKRTQGWLERYTYLRSPKKSAIYITYLVSSVWHGLYPGFFIFFLTVPFCQFTIQSGFREYFNPLFINMSKYNPRDGWKEYPKVSDIT